MSEKQEKIKIRCTRNEQLGIIRQVKATVGESFPCLVKYMFNIATENGDEFSDQDCLLQASMRGDCDKCLKTCIDWEITD